MIAAQTQEAPVITNKSGRNNKFTKIALIALAIVFLIIIAEVAYFIFAKRDDSIFNVSKTAQQEKSRRAIVSSPPQPTASPAQEKQEKDIVVDSDKARVFADMLDSFANNNKLETFDIATINYKASGVVIASDFDEKEVDNINYAFRLVLRRQNGSIISYWFTDEEIIYAQVSLSSILGESEISITDIRLDDIVVIKITINLLDESPHSDVILEVTKQNPNAQ